MVEIETIPSTRKLRQSHHIKRKPASNLYWAVRVAEASSLTLTHSATLNFSLTACPSRNVSAAFQKLRTNYFGKWARRPAKKSGAHPFVPTYVWVIEAAGDQVAVHWLVYLPTDRVADFHVRLPTWFTAIAGKLEHGATHVMKAPTPRGAAAYMLKGTDPIYARFYSYGHTPQGLVHGKRSGFSLNLGPSVKRALGLKPRMRYSEQQARNIARQADHHAL